MKININRAQWEAMGKQAGWMKTAEAVYDEYGVDKYRHQPGTRDIPLKTIPYRGFNITIHQPQASINQNRDLYHYKIDGVLTEGNLEGLNAAIEKAKKTVDEAIAASPGGGHDEILEYIKPFKVGYAPGQTPYTPEELKIHDKMISDAIKGDPGERNEGDDNVSRRRTVMVTFSDGDTVTTDINGTKKEIMNYYLPNGRGIDQDYDINQPDKVRHPVKVEFIG